MIVSYYQYAIWVPILEGKHQEVPLHSSYPSLLLLSRHMHINQLLCTLCFAILCHFIGCIVVSLFVALK